MHSRNPYLQAGVFLALMFTAVAMTFGSFGQLNHHPDHRQHRHHQQHDHDFNKYESSKEMTFAASHAPNISVKMTNNNPDIQLPTWPGCNDSDYEERIICTVENLIGLLKANLQPMEGQKGRVIALYDVALDGKITNSELYEGDNPSLTAETMRMVGIMQGADIRWTPGTVKGTPRVLKFGIGIDFNQGCSGCAKVDIQIFEAE